MKIRKLNAATALGSLTASVALLAGMPGAHAQGAPGAGSFPGSFLVPGTQTSFKVGGYVKFDYTYDFSAQQIINGGAAPFGAPLGFHAPFRVLGETVPLPASSEHKIHGTSQMTASESRFNIETRTPTAYGELKTFIEGDFTNPNGLTNTGSFKVNSDSYGFRLRQAYGTLGPFLAGQTLSLFRDGASEAETLDFGGAQATGVTRQPQVRYTFDFGNGLTWAVAAENPQTQAFTMSTFGGKTSTTFGQTPKQGDKIPDFTTAVVYNAPWGHLKGAAVFRDLYWHSADNGSNVPESGSNFKNSTFGWAVAFSGNWNVPIGKDSVAWELAYGQGAGRYVNSDGPPTPDIFVNGEGGGTIKSVPSWLIAANYTHFWTDTLRTNLAGSLWGQRNKNAITGSEGSSSSNQINLYKSAFTAHANLIWSPVPQTNFGVEYIWMKAKTAAGQQGITNRLQASAQFKF
jgi:hypothetical protein